MPKKDVIKKLECALSMICGLSTAEPVGQHGATLKELERFKIKCEDDELYRRVQYTFWLVKEAVDELKGGKII